MKPISHIAKTVPASGIRKFFDIVSQMDDVISLGVGEPDFVTPWRIREACIYSLEKGYTNYTSNYGLLELRKHISTYLNERWGLHYNPENQILVTVGVSEGLDLATRAILNPGEEVLIPEPSYVSYKPCVLFAGGVPVPLGTTPESGFKVTPEQIAAAVTPRTKALLISYPSNPTGATISREELQAIVDVAREHDLFIISDEIYDRLTYEGHHTAVPELNGAYERTILLNGFSKAYAMTGWRIAYAASTPDVIEAMMKIHQYTMLCAPIMSQMAAIEAIKNCGRECDEMAEEYNRRRRLIVAGLNNIGLDCTIPGGAFYAFPSIKKTGLTSEEFSERLLFEEKVAVVPGNAFGECGEGYIRCSYATGIDQIKIALERMERFVENLGVEGRLKAAGRE
ncbi:MAG TPA: aminotransferase class I/II-fold pyridoxal phosphate-dependent enzyme [Armatimonadota bacterium]|nr:aminotransferase class I/II-fold pyridoxal phosphate-dependent enzyme [Armatimonadota bacterium]